jgi:hypothetical protein
MSVNRARNESDLKSLETTMAYRLISLDADGHGRIWVNPELISRIIPYGLGSTIYFDGVSGVATLDRCPGPINVRGRPLDIARQVKQLSR